jgi:hypothetical protein
MVTVVFQEWLEPLTVKIESFYDGVLPALISVCPTEYTGGRVASCRVSRVPSKAVAVLDFSLPMLMCITPVE